MTDQNQTRELEQSLKASYLLFYLNLLYLILNLTSHRIRFLGFLPSLFAYQCVWISSELSGGYPKDLLRFYLQSVTASRSGKSSMHVLVFLNSGFVTHTVCWISGEEDLCKRAFMSVWNFRMVRVRHSNVFKVDWIAWRKLKVIQTDLHKEAICSSFKHYQLCMFDWTTNIGFHFH